MSNKLNFILRAKYLKNNPPTIDEEIQQIINNNHLAGTKIENIIPKEYEEDSDTETSDENNMTNLSKNLYKTNGEGLDYFSGPYEYKIYLENKEYPHSVNINKLIFKY